jgi:hypothetical protein
MFHNGLHGRIAVSILNVVCQTYGLWFAERVSKAGNLARLHKRCNNRFSMGHRLPQELLEELRTYLEHFDQTGHLGESDTVAEIKRRLRDRIGEVEATLKMPPAHAPAPDRKYTTR